MGASPAPGARPPEGKWPRGAQAGYDRGVSAPSASPPREAPPLASPAAFDLPGGPDAALLLHGLTGSPHEVRPVAERLNAMGVRCRAPVLPGHGGAPAALDGLPWSAWLEGARRELAALGSARRVLLVGCSMGALLACALAHGAPERVSGLVLLAPALRLRAAGRLGALLGRHLLRHRHVPKAAGSDVRDPVQRKVNPGLAAVPLSAVAELAALARHVEGLLPAIRAPALVIAARHDHTVALAGARRLARRLHGPARLVILERSFHLVGIDVERDRCAGEVARFHSELTSGAAGGG